MTSQKIALFIPALSVGGLEGVFISVASGLAAQGFDVDCLVMQGGGAFEKQLPATINLINLDSRAVASPVPLARYLRSVRPSHLIGFSEPCNLAAIVARWLARVPVTVIITVHNTLSLSVQHTRYRKEKLYPFFARRLYPYVDHFIAVSLGVAQDYADFIGLDRAGMAVVYNPIPVGQIQQRSKQPVDHPWFTQRDKPILLAVNRMEPQKDYPTLIRAFATLREDVDCRLCVVGDGSQWVRVEALVDELGIREHVLFTGMDTNPFKYMARADVFLLSSVHEGFGNVMVEALACGCNVVATDCPHGPAEILANGQFGRLVPVGDHQAMAAAIEATLDDPLPGEQLRNRALDFVPENATKAYAAIIRGDDVIDG